LEISPRTIVGLKKKRALFGAEQAEGKGYAFVEEDRETAAVGAGQFDRAFQRAAGDGDPIAFLYLPFILAGSVKVHSIKIVPAPR